MLLSPACAAGGWTASPYDIEIIARELKRSLIILGLGYRASFSNPYCECSWNVMEGQGRSGKVRGISPMQFHWELGIRAFD